MYELQLWSMVSLFVCLRVADIHGGLGPFKVLKTWKYLDFDTTCLKSIRDVQYQPSDIVLSGIKIYRNKIFLSTPRLTQSVPVTLSVIELYGGKTSPLLKPFPSWEHQKIDNCEHVQSVRGFEIDRYGRLWALDSGSSKCPPKIVIFDLNTFDFVRFGRSTYEQSLEEELEGKSEGKRTREENEQCKNRQQIKIVRRYEFPEDILPRDGSSCLDDIVIDSDGWFGYITSSSDSSLIVYSYNENKSWKQQDDDSMKDQTPNVDVTAMEGIQNGNINSVALSPPDKSRRVYYAPLGSLRVYSVATQVLKNRTTASETFHGAVKEVGLKRSVTEGMMMDNSGKLYFGQQGEHSVAVWQSSKFKNMTNTYSTVARDDKLLTWPDTFAFDNTGNLYFTTNRGWQYHREGFQKNETNFRIFQGQVGGRSYQHGGFLTE